MGDAAAIEARVAEELGAGAAAGIAALARSMSRLRAVSSNPTTQPAPPAEITVDVAKADADKAGGTSSDIANAKIIREAASASPRRRRARRSSCSSSSGRVTPAKR
jgi:hypothetical protein